MRQTTSRCRLRHSVINDQEHPQRVQSESNSRRRPWSREPRAPQEWQDCLDKIALLMLIDSARQYGLISGGPLAKVDRCLRLMRKGERLGYHARPTDELLREAFGPES